MKKILVSLLFVSSIVLAAPNVTIDFVSADNLTKTVAAFCNVFNYEKNKIGAETEAVFAKRMLVEQIKKVIVSASRKEKLAESNSAADSLNDVSAN